MEEQLQFISAGQFISEGDWIHPARTLDSYELIYVQTGRVMLEENGVSYALMPGDLLCLYAGLPHRGTETSRDTSFYWVHFTAPEPPTLKRAAAAGNAHLTLFFRQLLHFANTPGYDRRAPDYLLRLILIEADAVTAAPAVSNPALVNRVEQYVLAHLDRPLTAAEVAAACGYNTDYLSRLIRAAHGVGLKQWISARRLERAQSLLLSTEWPLKEVAARCGFEDYKGFLKFFTYHTGTTPTQLRRTCYRTHINHR